MTTPPLFDRLCDLLGKRSDDPAVVAYHAANGFKPPPVVRDLDSLYDVPNAKLAYSLDYLGELLVVGLYPPRKEKGRWVGYLASATVRPSCKERVTANTTTALVEKEAKALAKKRERGSWDTGVCRGYVVERRGGNEVVFVYDGETGALEEVRLQVVQLEEDDPALAASVTEAGKASATTRVFPATKGKPRNEPLPPALAALAKLAEGAGLGELDLELLEEIETGGPTAWTNNPDAEHQLRVFAQDGTGGLVAFWLVHWVKGKAKPLEEQPVVFLGSEGKVGPVAKDLPDFLALLAAGLGPVDIVEYGASEAGDKLPKIAALAKKHFPGRKPRKVDDILDDASRAYGDFEAHVASLGRRA